MTTLLRTLRTATGAAALLAAPAALAQDVTLSVVGT